MQHLLGECHSLHQQVMLFTTTQLLGLSIHVCITANDSLVCLTWACFWGLSDVYECLGDDTTDGTLQTATWL